MHHYRLRYDDFWSTGIWVGLRIFMVPAIVAMLFLSSKDGNPVSDRMGNALAPMNQSLAQITSSLGGMGGLTAKSSSDYFKPGPGAKWVRP